MAGDEEDGKAVTSEPLDPGVGLTPKDGFFVFATWLGGAELAVMLGVGGIGFFSGKMETLPEGLDLLWEASIAGAVVGCLPAVAAGVLVKRSRVWALAGLSLLVTMATVATLYFMLGRG